MDTKEKTELCGLAELNNAIELVIKNLVGKHSDIMLTILRDFNSRMQISNLFSRATSKFGKEKVTSFKKDIALLQSSGLSEKRIFEGINSEITKQLFLLNQRITLESNNGHRSVAVLPS